MRRRLLIVAGVLAALFLLVVFLRETYVWGDPEAGNEQVLLVEDFAAPSKDWQSGETESASFGWDAGAYAISVRAAGHAQFHSVPIEPAADGIEIRVEAIQRAGNADDTVGVFCGGPQGDGDASGGYLVFFSPRGGDVAALPYTSSDAGFKPGKAPVLSLATSALNGLRRKNDLRIECLGAATEGGAAVTVSANGERIGRAALDRGPRRFDHVGVFASNETGSGSDAVFDNLTVTALEEDGE